MRSGSPAEQRLLRAAVRILCDYLAVHGFLRKDGTRYRLTPSTSIFLTTTSPAWMGSVVDFLASPEMMNLWGEDPVGFVRNGGSVGLGSVAPDHPMWVTFAKAMVPFMAPVAHGVVAEVTNGRQPRSAFSTLRQGMDVRDHFGARAASDSGHRHRLAARAGGCSGERAKSGRG